MKRYWLILLPLFFISCGVMVLPATVGNSSGSKSVPVFDQKPPILANSENVGMLDAVLCVTAAETLNLRLSPSTSAPADPNGLQHGDTVVRIGAVAGWYKVQAGERVGWVKSEYVSVCDG